jgi:hypothetical protein
MSNATRQKLETQLAQEQKEFQPLASQIIQKCGDFKTSFNKVDLAHASEAQIGKLQGELDLIAQIISTNQKGLIQAEQEAKSLEDLKEVHRKSQQQEDLLKQHQQKSIELEKEIQNLAKLTSLAKNQISNQLGQMAKDQQQVTDYEELIRGRAHVIATRDRMLQLSQERNMYKKKIIYVLLAIIIGLLVAIIATYLTFTKRRG